MHIMPYHLTPKGIKNAAGPVSGSKVLLIMLFVLGIMPLPAVSQSKDIPALKVIATGGHTVYHLQPATIKGGNRAIVSAAFDGTIMCHLINGELVWKKKIHNFFPFDLATGDIDNDGRDEVSVVTAGGTLDVMDSEGRHLWTFNSKAPLYQVCPVKTGSGKWIILTGGVEGAVHVLSDQGRHITDLDVGDVVRHIRKGKIMGNGHESVAIATTSSGLSGKLSLMLLDPASLKVLWRKTDLGEFKPNSGKRFFSMAMTDVNQDGKEDIILSGTWGDHGKIYGFDYSGKLILESSDSKVPVAPYRMNLLTRINPKDNSTASIFGLFANYLIIYGSDGKFQSVLKTKYDYTSGTFDPQSNTYFVGSSSSGGDGIYAFNLGSKNWKKKFEELRPYGKLAQIEKNIARLKDQVSKFERPAYQRTPGYISVLSPKPQGLDYDHLKFADQLRNLSEQYGNRSELWCRDIDKRMPYNMSADEIINTVRKKEADGKDFMIWVAHGEAVYMRPATMEKIIQVAPKHFLGFVFTEMESVGPDMQEMVEKIMLPLAEQCAKAGKKIIFFNKNIFWAGTCYLDFLRGILLNPKFKNVFVPAVEETNSRTQELSLAGRVGLWQAGFFDQWAVRSVTDNAAFDRMWEWSSQQVLSHHIREMVMGASHGSDIFFIDIFQPNTNELRAQLLPFYELIDKGVVAIPKRGELLSVSDICLGMKSPPSENYIRSGTNGHRYSLNPGVNRPMVFDRLDAYWGGSPVQEYDFSSYGYGCDRRMLNFLPSNPYGMVSIVPEGIDVNSFPWLKEKITTDGEFFYDSEGKKQGSENYKQTMLQKLQQSASRLPVLVKGDVAWSVVRLDPTHVRVTLIDPGYTDPADRDAEIVLQRLKGTGCVDILSKEKITIKDQKIHVRVPAGIFRVIDIEHQ